MTTSKQYDFLNRLTSISSTPSNSFGYLYNAANQRTMNRLADSSYWQYGYDALGQVISGNKYWADETPVAGQQFDYAFDTIGNRTQTQAGGDQNGANLRVANYTNNSLNQMTSRAVPGYVDVMGLGIATNPVSVNGTTAYRKNEYFREQLSAANTSAAVWDSITITNGGNTNTGHLYVAKTPELYTYDTDGNLLSDGRWNYTWDAENRLLSMTSLSGAPSGSLLQLSFAYDYIGRRIQKLVSTNNGSSYIGEYTNKYAYDGWNCVGVLNPSFVLSNSFLWGSDLSGSVQGAGGVGGLIKVAYYGVVTTNCFVAYDGNGNVSALVNAANGVTLANYEYGPFGEVIRATGPMAKLNPFRFSTKYQDDETDMDYYGYRFYNPSTGRWLSRDPAGEDSGEFNLYGFVCNAPINDVDDLGLLTQQWIIDQVKALDASISSQTCCCDKKGISKVAETITGTHSGTVVTGTATVYVQGCVDPLIAYYWWTCYDAAEERNPFFHSDWKNYGWHATGTVSFYSKDATPGFWSGLLGTFDPYHIAMDSMVSYTYCGPDGHRHATYRPSKELIFTWNKKTKSWTGP